MLFIGELLLKEEQKPAFFSRGPERRITHPKAY